MIELPKSHKKSLKTQSTTTTLIGLVIILLVVVGFLQSATNVRLSVELRPSQIFSIAMSVVEQQVNTEWNEDDYYDWNFASYCVLEYHHAWLTFITHQINLSSVDLVETSFL